MVVRRVRRRRRTEPITRPEALARGAGSMTVQECREILGESVTGKSDEQIAAMLDDLEHLAAILYDDVRRQASTDLEAVRWTAYAVEHPEDAC
jgi:hypothetical protein